MVERVRGSERVAAEAGGGDKLCYSCCYCSDQESENNNHDDNDVHDNNDDDNGEVPLVYLLMLLRMSIFVASGTVAECFGALTVLRLMR